jgi:hypothetical protein
LANEPTGYSLARSLELRNSLPCHQPSNIDISVICEGDFIMPLISLALIFALFSELWDMFRQPKYRSLLYWVIFTLAIGTIFYSAVEGWSLLDSLYFCVVTLGTVGFGDLAPLTTSGRAFTIFYILFGLSILAAFLNMLAAERRVIDERRAGGGNENGA